MTRKEAAVVAVAVVLRLALALVNREANDDHLAVIAILADQGRAPQLDEVWEAFQPKLYHATVAAAWRMLGLEGGTPRVLAAQLLSAAAGIVTVLLLARFLATLRLAPRARLLTLAVVALEPGVLTIGAQATNDALVTALGALTVLAAARFFATDSASAFATTTAAAAATTLAKGNGIGLPLAVLATLALEATGRLSTPGSAGRRLRAAALAGAFAAACVAAAALGGPYAELHRRFGSPFANPALAEAPWPRLLERDEHARPGVRSVREALLTFRLADMLRQPTTSHDDPVRDLHRTSFWSQVYGRATFSRFAAHPQSWSTDAPAVLWLGRLLLVLGLVPAALLALGMMRSLLGLVATALRPTGARGRAQARTDAFLTILAWGQLVMIALYALRFRDFSGMKDVFLHPALLAYAALLAREVDRVERARRMPWLAGAVAASLAALVVLQVVDVGLLVVQLAGRATW